MDYTLLDDGTLDTVIEVTADGKCFELRYSDTSAYRRQSGALDLERFWAEVAKADVEDLT